MVQGGPVLNMFRKAPGTLINNKTYINMQNKRPAIFFLLDYNGKSTLC